MGVKGETVIQDKYMHKAQFLPTATAFSAVFNAITPGRYDFGGTPACQNVPVIQLPPGCIFWLRRLSVGGNVPQEDYLSSVVAVPSITVRRTTKPDPIYRFPIAIDKYIDSGDCEAWIVNDRAGEFLTLSLSGSCMQPPAMIGVATLTLNVSINIYQFNDQEFAAEFRGRICR